MSSSRLLARCCALLLVAVLTAPVSQAQTSDARPTSDVAPKYWVFFKDKGEAAGKATAAEAGYLSERARARRTLRGSGTVPPRLDAPLAPGYVESVRQTGAEVLVESRWLNAVSARLWPEQVEAVRRLPSVREIQLVGSTSVPVPPEVPRTSVPEHGGAGKAARLDYGPSRTQLAVMNAIAPLERGLNGEGVRLGFLDSGFGDFQHPVFARLRADGRLVDTADFTTAQGPQSSLHGQAVASAAVGFAEGVLIGPAWGAEVLAATTEYAPTETNQEEDNFVAGMEWMEQHGADVVNVSLGYTTFDIGQGRQYTPADLDGDTGVTTRAADLAASLGVVVVTSAGNSGCDGPANCWYYVGTPADGDSVIAVGAVDRRSAKAPFSSFGPTADGRIKPDVAAQGDSVVVAVEGDRYAYADGTSFSSPLVAAVVCQMLEVNPALTPIAVRDVLRATASQADAPDNALGWGIVDAEAAIQNALALPAEPPPAELPTAIQAAHPYPNPVRDRVTFELAAPPGAGVAEVSLYNVLGQRQTSSLRQPLQPGLNALTLSTAPLAPGLYLYVIEAGGERLTGSVVVIQ